MAALGKGMPEHPSITPKKVFNGKSIVHEGAQKSSARQVNRNLLLTPGAEIDTNEKIISE